MAREIIIDEDTRVGYSYVSKVYYIENKGTTTYRTTALKAKEVLDIVAPTNEVPESAIHALSTTYEAVHIGDTEIYYTWDNTGAYIKTIQIHDYKENPLTLEADKGMLYIMNTNLIFDLSLNESKEGRVQYILSHYKNVLGIDIDLEVMNAFYDLLYSFYQPTVFNHITPRENINLPLYYNNIFELSNYSNTSKATYTCTYNPTEEFTGDNIGDIYLIDTNSKTVYLTGTDFSSLAEGQKINIQRTTKILNEQPFTDDGTYTITEVEETSANKGYIKVLEQPIITFEPDYKHIYLKDSTLQVQTIYRDTSIINFTEVVPNTIKVGDVLTVRGTGYTSNDQTITADGDYTICAINGSNVTVQETPQINYNYTSGTRPEAFKKWDLGIVETIIPSDSTSTITLKEPMTSVLSSSTVVILDDIQYTVTSSTTTSIAVSSVIETYTVPYGKLQKRVPTELVTIEVTYSKDNENFPEGKFTVDTFYQCRQYIKTYTGLTYPSNNTKDLLYSKVPLTYAVEGIDVDMNLLGLYSEIYN